MQNQKKIKKLKRLGREMFSVGV